MATALAVVLPGDDVTDKITSSHKNIKLGIGLRTVPDTKKIYATCAGSLEQRKNTYYIQQSIRRYRPSLEDRVIGIVEERIGSDGAGGDIHRVNIGGPHPAMLSSLSFEGATKRNKPHLKRGMLLYCRILATPPLSDPTLSCQLGPHDGGLVRKDWMTNEGTYGELQNGTCTKIPLGLARELLNPKSVVLLELAKQSVKFEIATGVNGFVWIHSSHPEYTIMIQNAILNSQVMTEPQIRAMVKTLVQQVNKQIVDDDDGDEKMED